MVSRATPITLAVRDDLPWLLGAVRRDATPPEPEKATAQVLACLRERGALFFAELAQAVKLPRAELAQALWDGVARGLFAADGFDALRSLLEPESRSLGLRRTARGLRRGGSGGLPREGRWALLPRAHAGSDADELAEAVAEQLLSRWGVVFKDILAREPFTLPYRDLVWAFRRMEARGAIRGGRFVGGFVGEQYALPEAVELLRSVRRSEPSGERVRLSACDPLNLAGILLPGPRVPALRGNFVTYVDGTLASDEIEVRLH